MWGTYGQDAADAAFRQQRRIDSEAAEHASRERRRSDDLEDRLDRLVLLNEAMWELLSGRLGVTVDELAAKLLELDGRSGAMDGRRQPAPARRCPSCDAAVAAGVRACQYCGAAVAGHDPFAI